ncbi:hypothetical protein DXT74_04690 [Chromobacterium sp. Rain0013]|nr:hypothetical protein DXT74_04690 [Chromobacterium sp. Rain0013]
MHITDVLRKTIHNPATWSKQELYDNLQAAVDVELWTIPLYLTTLYSIQGLNSGNQQAYPTTAKLIESVVIQEMLHLELISNLCNALGYSPQYPFPTYEAAEGIPFLKPDVPPKYAGYQVKLGPLDINQLKLFCVIELPAPPRQTGLEQTNTIQLDRRAVSGAGNCRTLAVERPLCRRRRQYQTAGQFHRLHAEKPTRPRLQPDHQHPGPSTGGDAGHRQAR